MPRRSWPVRQPDARRAAVFGKTATQVRSTACRGKARARPGRRQASSVDTRNVDTANMLGNTVDKARLPHYVTSRTQEIKEKVCDAVKQARGLRQDERGRDVQLCSSPTEYPLSGSEMTRCSGRRISAGSSRSQTGEKACHIHASRAGYEFETNANGIACSRRWDV